ncbi:MAG: putative transport system permease protein, partial [Bradyrhizobium sp.]|nr:putative transport system permease protein [Bradyrhizobium sp.]
PSNTHFADLDLLVSGKAPFSALAQQDARPVRPGQNNFNGWTYVRLRLGIDPAEIERRLPDFVARHFPSGDPTDTSNAALSLGLEPVTAIHLSRATGTMKDGGSTGSVAAVSLIAVLIMAIAGINFVNLMTARATRRAREVGIRKALGATWGQLVVQFMLESLAYAALATFLAAVVVELALPAFDEFLDRRISFTYWRDPDLVAGTVILVLLVGLGSGFYPALVLSAFRPANALKAARSSGRGGQLLRQVLVILQFAASVGLAVATLVILRQTDFATGEILRFDKNQVVLVRGAEACTNNFRDRVTALPGIRGVACSRSAPLSFATSNSTSTLADGRKFDVNRTAIGFGFFDLYGLKLLAGRDFDPTRPADVVPEPREARMTAPIIINQTAVRAYGFSSPNAALGQEIILADIRDSAGPSQVIGVVPDFPIGSIRDAIQPTVFYVDPGAWGLLSVKLDGTRVAENLAAIDRIWNESVTDRPIRRFFLDARIEQLYRDIVMQGQIFAGFAAVALLISCLGLFSLSAYTAERRTKEIGIRKVLGASDFDIVRLLVWQFAQMVLLANAIAWPVAWWFMRSWLDGFAYRVPLTWQPFALAGATALAIAVLTTCFHALQVARAKPVKALRYE